MEWNLGLADDVGFYIHSQGSLVLETLEKSANVKITVKVNFKYCDREINSLHRIWMKEYLSEGTGKKCPSGHREQPRPETRGHEHARSFQEEKLFLPWGHSWWRE